MIRAILKCEMEGFKTAIFLLLVSLYSSSITAIKIDEASALFQFKQSSITNDPKGFLDNWTNDTTLCSWVGVVCSELDSRIVVVGLTLTYMGLIGSLNLDIIMALPNLNEVDLRGNYLSSFFSSSTSPNCNFKKVDISSNNISDSIPDNFLATCYELVSLNLSRNMIPGGVFNFGPSLQVVDLSHNQIVDVNLPNYSLSNCRNINYLNLSDNKLSGRLPEDIFTSCANLTVLDLSHNNLTGELSSYDFGFCKEIRYLDISYNSLNGSGLPMSLAKCMLLEKLALSGNNISGELPSFWRSFPNLKQLHLADNKFSGEIPPWMGSICGTLVELDLSRNQLTGELPTSFSDCSSLESLNLGDNQLSGDFIERVVGAIASLKYLYLPFNNISGTLPLKVLTNCASLQIIDLSSNNFSGEIPTGFGFCDSIPYLTKLLVPNNYISGEIPPELGNCINLELIDFSFNELTGTIPSEIWSLPNLTDFAMWANNLRGEIPQNLCTNTRNLETLILSYNNITGVIPPSLINCTNLIWVSLSGNKLTGTVPANIGNLKKLAILQLGNNMLSGSIPPDLGNCQSLIWLDLASNSFTGSIPKEFAAQTGLVVPGIVSGKRFAFLRNEVGNSCPGAGVLFEFEGIRPERLANSSLVHSCNSTRIYTGTTVYTFASNGSIIYMDLSYNSLNGLIPKEFGPMSNLIVLNLGHNELTGDIPESFGGLKMIGVLDLSHNHLTGFIPGALGTLSFLNDMDVSDNNLSGPIPTGGQLTTFLPSRYANNSGLCGVPLPPCGPPGRNGTQVPNSNSGKNRIFVSSLMVGIIVTFVILISLVLALLKLRTNQRKNEAERSYLENAASSSSKKLLIESLSIRIVTFEKPLRELTYAHLVEATNNFNEESLIGSGGFGEVYRAKLGDNSIVAVKKLVRATGQGDREFIAEMETIGKIKHRNLVPLLGYCKVGDERLLVYEYMKHGSLDIQLQTKSNFLTWSARKKIAIGSARGLAFLHHSCIPHIIHRDMKSSNVLLDENLNARVSDFGMARLMNVLDTHLSVSTLAGTPGYVPPEYYQSFRCTTKGDVYSYGVVLLELLSGKKPTDTVEFGDNNLVGWAKQLMKENRRNDIIDCVLLLGKESNETELHLYLKIAFECLEDRPFKRPTMIQVMAMFKELQIDCNNEHFDTFSSRRSIIYESNV